MDERSPLSPSELFLLETWVADNPGSRQFLRLANAYLAAGRAAEAAEVLAKGLVLNPRETAARQLWAQALQAQGRQGEALDQLLLAAAELCGHAGLFEQLADLLDQAGRADQAERARRLAADLAQGFGAPAAPAWPPAAAPAPADTVTLAEIYAAQGHVEQAAAIYRRLLAKNPHDADLRRRLQELEPGQGAAPRPDMSALLLERLQALADAAKARLAQA
ncbi:MAG: tetratricopeptide repeat protein [Thermodesulfobacteriota bacterium]